MRVVANARTYRLNFRWFRRLRLLRLAVARILESLLRRILRWFRCFLRRIVRRLHRAPVVVPDPDAVIREARRRQVGRVAEPAAEPFRGVPRPRIEES